MVFTELENVCSLWMKIEVLEMLEFNWLGLVGINGASKVVPELTSPLYGHKF